MVFSPLLLIIGISVAAFGSLIGAGGGFLLVPILLFLYPKDPPSLITATSMGVVLCTTLSGTVAYSRMGRIDYRSGLLFAAAIIPGAILGVLATHLARRGFFETFFGLALLFLAWQTLRGTHPQGAGRGEARRWIRRNIVDRYGEHFDYSYVRNLGLASSFAVGLLANLFGIGGGPVQVPIMVRWLGFPITIATATSQLISAMMATAGVLTHLVSGDYRFDSHRVIWLAAGALIGGQIGPAIARRTKAVQILRLLAVAISLIGLYLIYRAFVTR